MVSTPKERQANRRLLSQIEDFDQEVVFGEAASRRQQNVAGNEGTVDQDFTVIINAVV